MLEQESDSRDLAVLNRECQRRIALLVAGVHFGALSSQDATKKTARQQGFDLPFVTLCGSLMQVHRRSLRGRTAQALLLRTLSSHV